MNTHRWPRATTADLRWGPLCDCGNLKTDQALTCTDCAVERRRAPNYWETRTCACGGPKMRRAAMCRPCRNELRTGVSTVGVPQPESHPWRRADSARLARIGRRTCSTCGGHGGCLGFRCPSCQGTGMVPDE